MISSPQIGFNSLRSPMDQLLYVWIMIKLSFDGNSLKQAYGRLKNMGKRDIDRLFRLHGITLNQHISAMLPH